MADLKPPGEGPRWNGKDRRSGGEPDPWDRLTATIRAVVGEELDARLADDEDDEDEPDDDDEESDDGRAAPPGRAPGRRTGGAAGARTPAKAKSKAAASRTPPARPSGGFWDALLGAGKPKA